MVVTLSARERAWFKRRARKNGTTVEAEVGAVFRALLASRMRADTRERRRRNDIGPPGRSWAS